MHTCCSVYAYIYIYIYLYIIYTRELRSIQGMHTCRYWCVPHVHYTVPKKAPLLSSTSSTFVSSTVVPSTVVPSTVAHFQHLVPWYMCRSTKVPSCMYAYLTYSVCILQYTSMSLKARHLFNFHSTLIK